MKLKKNSSRNLCRIALSILWLLMISLLTPSFITAGPISIMKLSEIKTGMTGEGKTIFKGTQIETFTFKVLGIVEKFSPDKDMIIVELDSPVLNEAGIIAGMSGSPAYIDGKLIGSVSYGFAFSKRPIGGITPIEDIIETSGYNNPESSMDMSDIHMEFDPQHTRLLGQRLQQELVNRMQYTPAASSFTPIKLVGVQQGFNPTALAPLNPIFTSVDTLKLAAMPQQSSTTHTTKGLNLTTNRDLLQLNPADAASIPLVKGDFEYSSVGTVTHVDGDNVYLFGHPFFNLGNVEFPLHKAEVISVVPSYQSSFKLASTRQMVGCVQQDRFSAVQGKLGKVPYMIPMKVFLTNRNRTFNLEMINHSLLTPLLSSVSLVNILSSQYQEFGFQSVKVNGKIFIEGERNIIIEDLYTGSDSFTDFSNLVMAINFFLMNNPEKHIKIQKMDFEITGSPIVKKASIEHVIINKKSFLPGEVINVSIQLKNEKGAEFNEEFNLKAPNLKNGATFYLMVADGAQMGQFDAKNVRSNYFPSKLNLLIRAINNLRKNNRVYLKIMAPSEGLFIKGYEYSTIPSSMQKMFSYNSMAAEGIETDEQAMIKYSTLSEYQAEVPAVVTGFKLFKLQIKERSDVQ